MNRNTFTFEVDDEGEEYLSMDHTECNNNKQRGVLQVKPGITAMSEHMVLVYRMKILIL